MLFSILGHPAGIADRHAQQVLDLPCDHGSVKRALAGFKRGTADKIVHQVKPLTHSILGKIVAELASDKKNFVLWTTTWQMTLAFYGMLRWDEVSNLRWNDIEIDGNAM